MTAKSTGDSEGSGREGTVRVGVIDSCHLLLVVAQARQLRVAGSRGRVGMIGRLGRSFV